jgi:hypothetical protein
MAQLTLPEELLLVTMRDADNIYRGNHYSLSYSLVGAAIIELILLERLQFDAKKNLQVVNSLSTGDQILDEMLVKLQNSKSTRSRRSYISSISMKMRSLKRRFMERLAKKGIVRKEERRILGIIPYTKFVLMDQSHAVSIRETFRNVLIKGQQPEERTSALIALLYSCRMLGYQFIKSERKQARKNAKELAKQNPVATAVTEQMAAVIAAVAAATS